MQFSALIAICLALLPGLAAAGGGFQKTCKVTWKLEGHKLDAECYTNKEGTTLKTRLNLDKCIANAKGRLVARDNGNFSRSCKRCTLRMDHALQCTCNGKYTSIDMNKFIENNKGHLKCFGHRAKAHDW